MPPYNLTFSEGEQLLWLPVCVFLFVSQGSGTCSVRISWMAKQTSEGVGFFYWRGSELYLRVHPLTIKQLYS